MTKTLGLPLTYQWVRGREHVTVEEVLRNCLEKQPRDWTQGDKTRVHRRKCLTQDARCSVSAEADGLAADHTRHAVGVTAKRSNIS
jgi:hypothetical protein